MCLILQIDWLNLTRDLFAEFTNYSIDASEKIVVFAPVYLANMSALVQDKLQTDDGKT